MSLGLRGNQVVKEVLRKDTAISEKLNKFLVTALMKEIRKETEASRNSSKASVCITQTAQLKLLKQCS